MIQYSLGEKKCLLDWNKFICLTYNNIKMYKSEFKDLANLYEVIDKNIKSVSNLLLDGHEYIIEKGILHNLYGPAYIKYNDSTAFSPAGSISLYFYIDGKLVCNTNENNRGCKTLEEFQNDDIFFFEKLNTENIVQFVRRPKEGIDYIKHRINLERRILMDQRKKKLKLLKNNE